MWGKGFVTAVVLLALVCVCAFSQDKGATEPRERGLFINQQKNTPGAAAMPLALRYSIFQATPNHCDALNSYSVIDPDASLRTGDCIRLAIESNSPGYLYVINLGTSGRLTVMPASGRSNIVESVVEPCQTYEFPSDWYMQFTDRPGEDKLYLVMSRERVNGFLSNDQSEIAKALGLRSDVQPTGLTSRALVIEKVKPPSAGSSVAPAASSCGTLGSQPRMSVSAAGAEMRQVIANLTLVHRQ